MRGSAAHDIGDGELWVDHRGAGPDVLLIAGLGEPVEAWQSQLDALAAHLIAFDNRGAGRPPMPERPLSVPTMADDAAAVLRALDVPRADVAGFSGGSPIAQELALRHPELVHSLLLVSTWARPDAYFRSLLRSWRWMAEAAASDRAFLEAFYVWAYTPRRTRTARWSGSSRSATFPHQPSLEALQRQIDAFLAHNTADRAGITAPTLVLAGGLDLICPPRYGRIVTEGVPGARFEVLPDEAHQPFQEVPEQFNARVDAFWHQVEAG